MFEKRHEELLPRFIFALRVVRAILVGWIMIVVALGIGMVGYHLDSDEDNDATK